MGHREVDGSVGGVGEVVVTALDMIEDVPRVLKGPDDLSRSESWNAGAHTALDGNGHPLADGTPESDPPLPRDRLMVFLKHFQVSADRFLGASPGLLERVTFGDHAGEHRDRNRVAAFSGRFKQDRVGVNGSFNDLSVRDLLLLHKLPPRSSV